MTVLAFNALALRVDGSGVQTYIRELLRHLARLTDARLVAAVQDDAIGALPDGVSALPRRRSAGWRRAWDGFRSLGPSDLVHGLDVDLPLRARAPTVATVHDLSVFDVPWTMTRRRAAGERLLLRQAVGRADAIVAVSAFTAERLSERLHRDAQVIPLAPSPEMAPPSTSDVEAVRAKFDLPETFVLHVGTVEPRKDTPTLAAACVACGVPLVLAGAVRTAVPPGTRALGYVDRGDLPGLFGAAAVVGYPSHYEGFGLPPLEAMACGAVVVATRTASLPEVLGDGAEIVPVGDVSALTSALRHLLNDDAQRSELKAAGLRRAASFSWEVTATSTLALYRSLGIGV